jgi:hypothetical protein
MSHMVISLVQPGETEKEVSGSTAHLLSKDKGNNSMPVKRRCTEDVEEHAPQDPRNMAKAKLLQSQFPAGAPAHPSLQRLGAMSPHVLDG